MQPSHLPFSAFRVGALAMSLTSGSLACGGAEPRPAPSAPSVEATPQAVAPQLEVPLTEAAPEAEAPTLPSSEEGSASSPPAGAIPTLGNLVTTQALLVSLLLAPFSTRGTDVPDTAGDHGTRPAGEAGAPTTTDPVGAAAGSPQTTLRQLRRTAT
jgi:hypothetical protein